MTPTKRSPYAKRRAKKEERYNFNDSFFNQNIKVSDYFFLPQGFEAFALMFYFLIIPYGVGLMVIYFFIAEGSIGNFLVLDLFTIVPVWSIGYETVAGMIMLNIVYSAVDFHVKKRVYLAKKIEEQQKMKKRNPSKYDILKNYS